MANTNNDEKNNFYSVLNEKLSGLKNTSSKALSTSSNDNTKKKPSVFRIGCLSTIGVILSVFVISFLWLIITDDVDATKENSKIELLISERKFDEARSLARKIEHKEPREAAISRINQAQLSLYAADGNWDDAQDLAVEMNAINDFQKLFSLNINKLLRNNQYDIIFNVLSTWHIQSPYFPIVEESGYTGKGDMYEDRGNVPYNEEVQAYNRIIDGVLQHLILEQNVSLIKKCMPLYKEEAVSIKKGKDYPYKETFKLQNKARQSAMEKLKAEGITIK